jgi:hypothetical protein
MILEAGTRRGKVSGLIPADAVIRHFTAPGAYIAKPTSWFREAQDRQRMASRVGEPKENPKAGLCRLRTDCGSPSSGDSAKVIRQPMGGFLQN